MSQRRRNHSPAFKAKMIFEVLKGQETVVQPAVRYEVHPVQMQAWKKVLHPLPFHLYPTPSQPGPHPS